MQVTDTENHERVLYVSLRKGQLEGIIERAIAAHVGIDVEVLRRHGKLTIEPNMEGSPGYQSGYCASFRATIPLDVPAAPSGQQS